MSTLKRITSLVLAVCMAVAIMVVPNAEVYAKAKVSTKNVNILVGSQYSSLVEVTYSKGDTQIKNIKTNSKNLIAKQTYQYWYNGYEFANGKKYGFGCIGLYATKAGTYKLTFDVCDKKGKKKSSHTVKVVASSTTGVASYPIKKATFNGKTDVFWSLSDKASGKFKVSMNNGYKLKSITMTTCDKKGNTVTKNIKNNQKVTLGQYVRVEEEDEEEEVWDDVWNEATQDYDSFKKLEWSYWMSTDLLATTTFTVTYQNTKTKSTGVTSYYIYRIPKN